MNNNLVVDKEVEGMVADKGVEGMEMYYKNILIMVFYIGEHMNNLKVDIKADNLLVDMNNLKVDMNNLKVDMKADNLLVDK
jgi:hypothetical protein